MTHQPLYGFSKTKYFWKEEYLCFSHLPYSMNDRCDLKQQQQNWWRWLLSCCAGSKATCIYFIEVQLICNVVPISAVQKNDSVIYLETFLFHILFHDGLSQDIKYTFLCYKKPFINQQCHLLDGRSKPGTIFCCSTDKCLFLPPLGSVHCWAVVWERKIKNNPNFQEASSLVKQMKACFHL